MIVVAVAEAEAASPPVTPGKAVATAVEVAEVQAEDTVVPSMVVTTVEAEATATPAAAGGKFVLPAHDCCQSFVPKVSPLTRYPSPRFLDILPSSFHVSLRFMPSKKIKKKKIRRFFRLSSRCSGLRTICAF